MWWLAAVIYPAAAENDGEVNPALALPVGVVVLGRKMRRAHAVGWSGQERLVRSKKIFVPERDAAILLGGVSAVDRLPDRA